MRQVKTCGMAHSAESSISEQIAAALEWWREAGVDGDLLEALLRDAAEQAMMLHMLAAQGIVSKDDAKKIGAGLDRVLELLRPGADRQAGQKTADGCHPFGLRIASHPLGKSSPIAR